MGDFDYDAVDAPTENERRKQLTDMVEEVRDVAVLSPWELHREKSGGNLTYVYNNTMEDRRPPLILSIVDDDLVKLRTTAYGEPKVVAGQCKMARKAMPKGESAYEWVQKYFILDE